MRGTLKTTKEFIKEKIFKNKTSIKKQLKNINIHIYVLSMINYLAKFFAIFQ